MAQFLRVGVHDSNVGGYTSKAWTIRRTGATVFLKWGAVEVRRSGRGRRIYWVRPQQKTIRCASGEIARGYMKKALARRLNHRYEKLPDTVSIGRRPPRRRPEPRRVLTTVSFVDIVHSTAKAAMLGDSRWNEVLTHYYAALRKQLRASRGREVNTTGDGMLAAFDGPTGAAAAIRYAAAVRRAVGTLGLEIRMGLHAGECELVGDAVSGIAVHIGARILAKADAGEILVSSTVKDLAVESGIEFRSRGLHKLKGVPEKWRLYRVL